VAGWWAGEWIKEIVDGRVVLRENTKRVSFLEFADLPRLTSQPLELALYLADDDGEDRQLLEDRGWRVRHSREVAQTPERYQAYIQRSRGEISCAKPSCMQFQNAWVSDRTLCYLASGKPVVVQDTGPRSTLPNGLGMFRFSSLEEAAEALQAVNADYARHCRAARELAETYFDATKIARRILDITLC
jgi:glycosyltransferase involved in cell wall biosynthesis